MNFSEDATILYVVLEYLQPFEFAEVTNQHNNVSYLNAATEGSTEYLAKYKNNCININHALHNASSTGQLESIKLLIKLGAKDFEHALGHAAKNNQEDAIGLLAKTGCKKLRHAIDIAVEYKQLEALYALCRVTDDNTFDGWLVASEMNMLMLRQLAAA